MELKPKIKYQLFLYNYFLQHIKHNLYNDYYNSNKIEICIREINILTKEITDINEINDTEFIKYKKSRGKHRKHLLFLTHIRSTILNDKINKLSQFIKIIEGISENENKFMYKNYDDYFFKHINYYRFLQKIKNYLKNKYDIRIENVYKNIYSPKMVTQHLENNIEIEEVFNILDKQIQNIMYNIF